MEQKGKAEKLIISAHEKLKLEDYEGAIADYDKAIKIDLNHAPAYHNRGIAKDELKDYIGAIADYDKAIEIEPKYALAYSNRGLTKYKLEDYKGAIADYDKAIEIDPNDASTYSIRGIAKSKLEDYEGAIADYNKAITINPDNLAAYFLKAISLHALNKTENKEVIIKCFEKVILINDDPETPLYQYMPINNKKLLSLINDEIYFCEYTKLNDPLECCMLKDDDAKWFQWVLEEEKIIPRIVSFNKKSESKLMYSHYADEHRGICVEYEINFKEIKKNKKISYGKVNYKNDIDRLGNMTDLYLLKNKEWEYEMEFRMVRFDNKSFINATIKSITFGLKCPEDIRQIIVTLLKKKKGIQYHEMKFKGKSNDLERVEFKLKPLNEKDLYRNMQNHGFDSLYHYYSNPANNEK